MDDSNLGWLWQPQVTTEYFWVQIWIQEYGYKLDVEIAAIDSCWDGWLWYRSVEIYSQEVKLQGGVGWGGVWSRRGACNGQHPVKCIYDQTVEAMMRTEHQKSGKINRRRKRVVTHSYFVMLVPEFGWEWSHLHQGERWQLATNLVGFKWPIWDLLYIFYSVMDYMCFSFNPKKLLNPKQKALGKISKVRHLQTEKPQNI